ncbi:MAG TPA: hypothetical protein PLF78_06780 [Caulobacter sp.]|nr:hypothetical protein [Caulobacter sp.]
MNPIDPGLFAAMAFFIGSVMAVGLYAKHRIRQIDRQLEKSNTSGAPEASSSTAR